MTRTLAVSRVLSHWALVAGSVARALAETGAMAMTATGVLPFARHRALVAGSVAWPTARALTVIVARTLMALVMKAFVLSATAVIASILMLEFLTLLWRKYLWLWCQREPSRVWRHSASLAN